MKNNYFSVDTFFSSLFKWGIVGFKGYLESLVQPAQSNLVLASQKVLCLGRTGPFSAKLLPYLASCLQLLGTAWSRGSSQTEFLDLYFLSFWITWSTSLGLTVMLGRGQHFSYYPYKFFYLEYIQNLGFSFYKSVLNLIEYQRETWSATNRKTCLQCL